MEFSMFSNNSVYISQPTSSVHLYNQLKTTQNLSDFYLISNGKRVKNDEFLHNCYVHIVTRLPGGKGGFGSMLRAIGAQIEKTTNREACRDLSGRRLRDINEEKRLKNWINQQAEREKEAIERKKKKLEKLCEAPKHEFKDDEYQKERSILPEIVEDAVTQGMQASCSGTKRKIIDQKETIKKKRPKLWVDDLVDEDISSSDDSQSDTEDKKTNNENVSNDISSEAKPVNPEGEKTTLEENS